MTCKGFKVTLVIWVACVAVRVWARRPRLRPDPTKPPRDYRPSKWLANSAMDVWYGNKTFVEIMSREFKDLVDKIALRPVRAPRPNRELGKDIRRSVDIKESKVAGYLK